MLGPMDFDIWNWRNPGPFRIGDRVRIPFGTEQVEGMVVEDRGHLGVGGERLYGVLFTPDDVSGDIYVERAADELSLVERPAPKRPRKKRRRE